MSMNGATLQAAAQTRIYNSLSAIFGPTIPSNATPDQITAIHQNWTNLAQAISQMALDIVSHIQTNATVSTTLASNVVSGVTVGTGNGAVANTAATGTVS